MTREILYSPDYGAGWTSWAYEPKVQAFMLEYKPFIDFLKEGGAFNDPNTYDTKFSKEEGNRYDWEAMEKEMLPVVFTFCKECFERFDDVPCLLGLRDLDVATVGGRVRINEYDGSESIEEEDYNQGWL